MNNYYPLVIGKMHIVNYELNNLKKNLPFRMDLVNIDKFRVIIICLKIKIKDLISFVVFIKIGICIFIK